jgi:hypothetical protein
MGDDDGEFFDDDSPTLYDPGVVPEREIAGESTPETATDPALLDVSAGRAEPSAVDDWLLGFQAGVAAKTSDIRRAIIAETMARGAPRSAAEAFAEAVLFRALGPG